MAPRLLKYPAVIARSPIWRAGTSPTPTPTPTPADGSGNLLSHPPYTKVVTRPQGQANLCTLWNHPDGAELRLDVEGRDSTTYADSDIERLVTVAEDWREELIESVGWKDMRPKP